MTQDNSPIIASRFAPQTIRRACPLCPADLPELGPDEVPHFWSMECSEPVTYRYPEDPSLPLVWETSSAPALLSWTLDCGHVLYAEEWSFIQAPESSECGSSVWFWWLPKDVWDKLW